MKNDFLSYYNNELAYLRESGEDFSKANPTIAGQLRLNNKGFENPHVARLIESFAFLTARIHRKIDDDLPELADALLDILYPHYQLPIPSLSIIQFTVNPNATTGYVIAEKTDVESSVSDGALCQFSTCYNVILYPIEITHLELIEKTSANTPFLPSTQSALAIHLRCIKSKMSFAKLNPTMLRFFINIPTPHSYRLYELLFRSNIGGFIIEEGKSPLQFSTEDIQPVGFEEHQGLFPYPEQSNISYRLLTEFFVFPEKFLFVDIRFKDNFLMKHNIGSELKIIICFNDSDSALRSILTHKSLALHCTPLVNLFSIQAEPICVDQTKTAYPIIPDARRLNEIEIYKVQSISLSDRSGTQKTCLPLYGLGQEEDTHTTYWQIHRENRAEYSKKIGRTFDVFVSFVHNTQSTDIAIAQPMLTCTNHQLPSQLPYGGSHPKLQLVNSDAEGTIHSLRPFTPCYHLPLNYGVRWQLISHLMLNTFSFSNTSNATQFLQEILHLYNFSHTEEHILFIKNIAKVETKSTIARGSSNYGNTVFTGTEVIVTVIQDYPTLFLFSSILEKFLSSYCAINSFTQLTLMYEHQPGEQIQWKPRMGSKVLL